MNVAITGSIGILASIASGWVSWFFTRKKYGTEVDANEIKNLKESLDFYESIVRDNKKMLDEYIALVEDSRAELYRLKCVIHRLLNNSCLKGNCTEREFYTEDQIREILEGATPRNIGKCDAFKA